MSLQTALDLEHAVWAELQQRQEEAQAIADALEELQRRWNHYCDYLAVADLIGERHCIDGLGGADHIAIDLSKARELARQCREALRRWEREGKGVTF